MEPTCAGNEYPAAESFNRSDDLSAAYKAIREHVASLQRVVQDSKVWFDFSHNM